MARCRTNNSSTRNPSDLTRRGRTAYQFESMMPRKRRPNWDRWHLLETQLQFAGGSCSNGPTLSVRSLTLRLWDRWPQGKVLSGSSLRSPAKTPYWSIEPRRSGPHAEEDRLEPRDLSPGLFEGGDPIGRALHRSR